MLLVSEMKKITIDHICKIYGHANLAIKVDGKKVQKAELEIFESSRYFESIVKGRSYEEAPELTSRICGICSTAHQMASLKAMEHALNIEPSSQTKKLREVLHMGGIIQSHVFHLYFLALPDYLGYDSAIQMSKKHGKKLKEALSLRKVGNDIITIIGGRPVHPISCRIGGFDKLPNQDDINKLVKSLKEKRKIALKTIELMKGFLKKEFERKTEVVALKNKDHSFIDGVVSTREKEIEEDYRRYIKEYHGEPKKTTTIEGKSYRVGPLARFTINGSPVRKYNKIKLSLDSPFSSNFIRAVEILYCIDRSIEILENIKIKKEAPREKKRLKNVNEGFAAVEAPRGVLFHHYRFNRHGRVNRANIITPTAQNLRSIEDDVKVFLPRILKKKKKDVVLELEKLIRAYDPCISCSTHFLEVRWL